MTTETISDADFSEQENYINTYLKKPLKLSLKFYDGLKALKIMKL